MTGVVVSPHCDDAVLSFGASMAYIRNLTVLTVFAGYPPGWTWPTPFDNASGFLDSIEAVGARRQEDRDACEVLRARAKHLDFLDGQYGLPRDEEQMVAQLAKQMAMVDDVAVPLGLAHPDHRLVAKCCRRALAEFPLRTFIVYADLPAAKLWPSHVPGALRGWERAGFALKPYDLLGDLRVKEKAVEMYVSQRRFPELAWENVTEEQVWICDV